MLGVFAHPDDEVIFGWPAMAELSYLLNISDNHNTYGPAPRRALNDVCNENGLGWSTVALPNEFYRLPTRKADFTLPDAIARINAAITEALARAGTDTVFTNNPWGEYGHGDHRLVHDIVIRHPGITYVWCSDICQPNECHLSTDRPPGRIISRMSKIKYNCRLDSSWYERMKRLYQKHNAWSWGGHDVVRTCNLYTI